MIRTLARSKNSLRICTSPHVLAILGRFQLDGHHHVVRVAALIVGLLAESNQVDRIEGFQPPFVGERKHDGQLVATSVVVPSRRTSTSNRLSRDPAQSGSPNCGQTSVRLLRQPTSPSPSVIIECSASSPFKYAGASSQSERRHLGLCPSSGHSSRAGSIPGNINLSAIFCYRGAKPR